MQNNEEESKFSDLLNDQIPECLYWSCEQVCKFFEQLNLPQYQVCNF